jgi:hypothetical protein
VSIKNKLVTAVTTAGLLAGLFGSAFVPAANAAAATTDPATVTAAEYTAVTGKGTSARPYGLATADLAATGIGLDLTVKDFAATPLVVVSKPLTYTASSGFYVHATSAACAANGAATGASVTQNTSAAGLACLTVKAASLTQSPGVGTVTISSVNGVIKTLYFANLGSVASVAIAVRTTVFSNHIAVANAEVTDYLTFTAKDSAGTVLEGVASGDFTQTNTNAGTVYDDGTGAAARLDLSAAACNGTKVSGDTITVKITHTATSVASNTVTLTCTGAANAISAITLYDADYSVLNGAAGSETSVAVYATLVDAQGRLVGEGGAEVDFETTAGLFAAAAGLVEADHIAFAPLKTQDNEIDFTGEITADIAAVYNEVELGAWVFRTDAYGKQSLRITVPNNDLAYKASSGLSKKSTFTVSYTTEDFNGAAAASGTATIAAGPKLKTATITISAAAGKLVTVTIEKVSTGKTFTYYRKANASGVAKFTIRRAGTWEVFASYGDAVSDTVKLKK